jgi:hypothetical protein
MRDEKIGVTFGDAAGEIGGANALHGIIRRKRIYELARDAAAIGLREEMLRLRTGDCETPAGCFQQIERGHLQSSLAQAGTTGNAIYEIHRSSVHSAAAHLMEEFRDNLLTAF